MEFDVYVGIGSNLEDPVEQCLEARARLAGAEGVSLIRSSSLYRSEPVGFSEQDWFVNAVCHLRTELDAHDLLRALQGIERDMGKRVPFRWGPRIIDLDLLLYGDQTIDESGLQVPHPRMHERRFVLQPMVEIAPSVEHPLLKVSMEKLLARLGEGQKVELIER